MSKLDIFLIDNSNNIIEEIKFIKPNTYQQLLEELKKNIKKLQNIMKYSN